MQCLISAIFSHHATWATSSQHLHLIVTVVLQLSIWASRHSLTRGPFDKFYEVTVQSKSSISLDSGHNVHGFQLTLEWMWSVMNCTQLEFALSAAKPRLKTTTLLASCMLSAVPEQDHNSLRHAFAGRLECTSPCGGACEIWLAVTDTKCSAWGEVYDCHGQVIFCKE